MKLKCAAKGKERRGAGTDGNLWGCEMRWREWSRKREEECSVTYRPTKKTKQKTQTQNPFIYFLFYVLNHRLQVQYNRDLQSMARWFIIETCCKCKGTFVQHFLLRRYAPPPRRDLWGYQSLVMHFSPNLYPFLSLYCSPGTLATVSSHGSYW